MISIKGSTQTWSNAQQDPSWKADNVQTVGAEDYKKAFGEKDIGEVLNKVADPNWVDPAKTRKVGNNQLDKDAFLKLLLTQLKYQDPTNPMESHEMAAQLAQFSSLESLSNIDKGIGNLQKAAAPKNDFAALNLIGKAVSGDSSKISRTDEAETHDIRYDLLNDAQKVVVKVLDANNQPVRELEFNDIKKGKNEVSWNGLTEDGQPARAGQYRLHIEAVGSNGLKVAAITQFEGRISGVNFTPQGPVLLVGNQSIRLSDVKKIVDPAVLAAQQVQRAPAAAGVAKQGVMAKAPSVPDGSEPAQVESNLESVGMSRGMVNEMKKQGVKAGL
ncbi:MAG: flagellar biosynthesis protein FlgD [Bdellovibrionaceae bacterium]|nr:flagellar biosynthesis protein FlgD [Bdellovibrionales bacterium]MCB9086473.1 flagellar biosynthesis protein FlgD [Pseudobdellovibrionaceae bacterium]